MINTHIKNMSINTMKVGQINSLNVVKQVPFGVYLDGGEFGEILLPSKVVPTGTNIDDSIEVFIYHDSEDKLIATTKRPFAKIGEFALLKVIDTNRFGAFLNWGLDKDLLVPAPEQRRPMQVGKSYLVYLKLDGVGRVVGSSKIDRFLDLTPSKLRIRDKIAMVIAENSPLGTKVIINNSHWGLLHNSDIFKPFSYGQKVQGYVKNIRADGKIDVIVGKLGQDKIAGLAKVIIAELNKRDGFIALHDKSSSEEIKRVFNESKKSYKNAIAQLYKRKEILIEDGGIRLVKK